MSTRDVSSPFALAERTEISQVVVDIFQELTPANLKQDFARIFDEASAKDFLDQVGNLAILLSPDDSYDEALRKFDDEIARLEQTRDKLLAELYERIRPLERSYRLLHLFFANAEVASAKSQDPIEFFVFNADPTAVKDPGSSPTVEVLKSWVQQRNDQFDFRLAISNIVVPGYVGDDLRKSLEELADKYGMLVIGDVDNEESYSDLERQFAPRGKYVFLKRQQDQAATDVILANWLKLRDRHWFEGDDDADGLYGPSSMVFAGALVRSDRTPAAGIAQGPVGMRNGRINGAKKARFEPLVSQTENLTMDRQLITIIRNADNELCFMGARSQAEDPNGTQKFFTTYRVYRFIQRMVENYVRQVAYQVLDRDVVNRDIMKPLREFFDALKKKRVIADYSLEHDYDTEAYAQGIVNLDIGLRPVGPGETFNITIRDLNPTKNG
jgi:hypothetical protein